MHDFTKLRVWSEGCELARQIYLATSSFPDDERYGFTSQMRRSSVSVAANIAEGAARGSPKEFGRFLRIAAGSASELETQIIIATSVGLLSLRDRDEFVPSVRGIRDMLFSLGRVQKNRLPG